MVGASVSPREFLRSRRPENFSDSVASEVPLLDRTILEYSLDTLTSRSEELRFEGFARRLLERTVCPNLLPHTGPTGGGDSKVDSETYPVAESLAMGWWVGNGNNAATERWAFAFSAKKAWRPKVRSDVSKLVGTGRGYAKAFFVSNQFISDRERADAEDKLSKEFGVDVRIFDRTWILDRVFSDRLERLAIDELGLRPDIRHDIRKGPLDVARENELEDVERRISDSLDTHRHSPGLVEDCLEAAILARGLERPRTEVEGLFERAARLAQQYGTPHQKIRVAYDRAWSSFWWYEDFTQFIQFYCEFEQKVAGSRNAYELELWTNLFFLLRTAIERGNLESEKPQLSSHTESLILALTNLSLEETRPSAALQASTQRIVVQIQIESFDGNSTEVDSLLRELAKVVNQADLLIGYPFEPLVQLLTELGDFLGSRPAYDELFEILINAAEQRKSEVAAARMLLLRGAQQLDAGHTYEAIGTLGRALGRLYKHETREEEIRALYLCARAYEKAGLLWAARGTMLLAASISTNEYWTHSKANPQQAYCYHTIKWLELGLGRLPHLLAWHEADLAVRAALDDRGYSTERLAEYDQGFDQVLAGLLLRVDLWELRELPRVPDELDRLGLIRSEIALKFALGHDDTASDQQLFGPEGESDKLALFRSWRDAGISEVVPSALDLCIRRTIEFRSIVLGCRIITVSVNEAPCIELGESILAAIEAFLATGHVEGVISREPTLNIEITSTEFSRDLFSYELLDRDGRPRLEVRCRPFHPNKLTPDEHSWLKRKVLELVVAVLARVFWAGDAETVFAKLFHEDLAPQRAVDFTSSFVVIGNVLGYSPKTRLSAWIDEDATHYPLIRDEAWDSAERRGSAGQPTTSLLRLADPDASPPAELVDHNKTAHHEMRTESLIRESLWNTAGWVGIGFSVLPGDTSPPVMALMFTNLTAAIGIFRDWRNELGPADSESHLRLSIIRGVSKTHPYTYRMVIGSDPTVTKPDRKSKYVFSVSRVHTMEPSTDINLRTFIEAYQRCGKYILTFGQPGDQKVRASLGMENPQEVLLSRQLSIVKSDLAIRDAWTIGPNDLDVVAILDDDDPIIPADQDNPPVRMLMDRRREDVHRRPRIQQVRKKQRKKQGRKRRR